MYLQNFLYIFMNHKISQILSGHLSEELNAVAHKVFAKQRISVEEGLILFEKADLGLLGILSGFVCQSKNGDEVYFNRNFHIEPSNVCIYTCKFCSYRHKQDNECWEYDKVYILAKIDEILAGCKTNPATEVHIVGSAHPDKDVYFYGDILKSIKEQHPDLHIKAFSAVEIDYMIEKAEISLEDGIKYLISCGLDSVPGGGAEIFDSEIRKQICPEKADAQRWLQIHQILHENGIKTNATILYGHIENYRHRLEHMEMLRSLQDQTHGFNAFIPLKFRNKNNEMSNISEVSIIEDLKNYAVSRIFLDNIQHLKAYWPAIGKQNAQLALNFGVDDLDGTIQDSTKIYTMAGSEEHAPSMSLADMIELIRSTRKIPVERDSMYNKINTFD